MANVAINGFGRIGRIFFRQVLGAKDISIVAINDLGDRENLVYLLKFDSAYGRYDQKVSLEADTLVVGRHRIRLLQEKDPARLPWKDLKVDVVVEATGVFEEFAKAKVHLIAGARRVVLTAPAKDEDGPSGKTVLMGINEDQLETTELSSNASCTTNAASPVIQVMHETVGVDKAILNTVHGYTATQNLVDAPTRGKDFRRGRAAAANIVPSTTGAAIALTRAVPELAGRFDGIAMRVPVTTGSIADITFVAKRQTSVEEINTIFKKAAAEKRWKGILSVTEDQLVSSDIVGEPYGAIVDLAFTKVVGGNLVKILSWYDNEWGYAAMLVRHVQRVISFV